jgi:signal peptidase I
VVGMLLVAGLVFWFHIGIQPVLSGSMRPAFGAGSAVITRPLPVQAIRSGDVIVFTPPGETVPYAHRVLTVSGPADDRTITTKGDANRAPDPWRAKVDGPTVPQVVAAVPWVGTVLVSVHSAFVRAALVALIGLALCLVGTRVMLRPRKRVVTRHSPAIPAKVST